MPPIQFFRLPLWLYTRQGDSLLKCREAAVQFLDLPEKLDWKKCQLCKAEEAEVTEHFKQAFKPFDTIL